MDMRVIFLVLNLIFLSEICKAQECSFPWQKVNDDICLFLTSITKTWDHAKLLCNFYGGDLLYIKNDIEQKNIQKYFTKLIKYRFNKKPYIWLDATDRLEESEWLWSRNNKTVNYNNWIPSYHNNGVNSNSMNCGCYKPNNGYWKDCDCSLRQHFTCRKNMENDVDYLKMRKNLVIEESPEMSGFNMKSANNDLTNDLAIDLELLEPKEDEIEEIENDLLTQKEKENEKSTRENDDELMLDLINDSQEILNHNKHDYDISSGNLLLDEITKTSTSLPITTKITVQDNDEIMLDLNFDDNSPEVYQNIIKRMLESPETIDREISQKRIVENVESKMNMLRFEKQKPIKKNIFETIMRIKVNKHDILYKDYHCIKGPGFYAIKNSHCNKYKYCEDWTTDYAAMSINKCEQNSIFDFRLRRCMPEKETQCNETIDFIPEI